MSLPKTIYAIAYSDYRLQSTNYNSHYMIYRRRKNAEKALEKIKKQYGDLALIPNKLVNKMHIVEYTIKE